LTGEVSPGSLGVRIPAFPGYPSGGAGSVTACQTGPRVRWLSLGFLPKERYNSGLYERCSPPNTSFRGSLRFPPIIYTSPESCENFGEGSATFGETPPPFDRAGLSPGEESPGARQHKPPQSMPWGSPGDRQAYPGVRPLPGRTVRQGPSSWTQESRIQWKTEES
jgi:hypothetical protein